MENIEMKTIGLIGGMSHESTSEYYRYLNEIVAHELGGLHSAKCIMYSVDFEEIKALMDQNKWQKIAWIMTDYAKKLEAAGADIILICTNTIHIVAKEVQLNIGVPLLHIADATGKEIVRQRIKKVGLLGTKVTMEHNFYPDVLSKHGIETIIPSDDDREVIDSIIFNELCLGKINPTSNKKIAKTIRDFVNFGAEGIILGCTELPMVMKSANVPLFDTTRIHAEAAIEFALKKHKF